MQETLNSIRGILDSAGYGPLAVSLSALLGLLSAGASACCTLPIIGALAGYSLARSGEPRRGFVTGAFFMLGMFIALLAVGGLVIFAGQSIQKVAGEYWKIAAGTAAILFGIGALELFPFKLPKIPIPLIEKSSDALGSGVFGVVFGGAVAVSSLPCNPGIFVILGAAVLQEHAFWALLNLSAYAIGFSLPLTALVYGLTAGRALLKLQKAERIIRTVAGLVLIGAGIYLFYSY